jgi:hypothetical protein
MAQAPQIITPHPAHSPDLGWNGSGGLKEALEFFDGHAIAVGTADGAVSRVSSPDELRRMRWEP